MHTPDWNYLALRASDIVGTPCYLMSELSIRHSLAQLKALETSVPLRHWVSLKTQPVARLVQMAAGLGLGVDVVSEHELIGALSAGVPHNRILVNGIGKRHWLRNHGIPEMTVHFDSVAEVRALSAIARKLNWQVGLRCAIPESAPDGRESPGWDQFGMTEQEIRIATSILGSEGVSISGLHFHLHTNVHRVSDYRQALNFLAELAAGAGIAPGYLDVGGGLPIPGETGVDGLSAADDFDFAGFSELLASVPAIIPSVGEVWLENGRFLSGPSGALVMTVLDRKERDDAVFLICDGGRVNHARMAAIERHEIRLVPERKSPLRKTFICGPTCGAVDRLGSWNIPVVEPGDKVMWLNAGAYHIPLETRFSTGLAPVVWFNARNEPEVIRRRETAQQWWGQWTAPTNEALAAAG